jgi:hypothetical protein
LSLDEASLARLNPTVQWYRNDTLIGTGLTFEELAFNCSAPRSDFAQYLCDTNGTVGPEMITATLIEEGGQVEVTWAITYLVWNPPPPPADNDKTNASDESDFMATLESNAPLVISAVVFTFALLAFLFTRRPKRPSQQEKSAFSQAPRAYAPPQFANVPSAPDLGALPPYDPRR